MTDIIFTCRPVSNFIPVKKFVFEKWLFEQKRQWIVMSLELKNIYLEEKGDQEGVYFWWILFQQVELVERSYNLYQISTKLLFVNELCLTSVSLLFSVFFLIC